MFPFTKFLVQSDLMSDYVATKLYQDAPYRFFFSRLHQLFSLQVHKPTTTKGRLHFYRVAQKVSHTILSKYRIKACQ